MSFNLTNIQRVTQMSFLSVQYAMSFMVYACVRVEGKPRVWESKKGRKRGRRRKITQRGKQESMSGQIVTLSQDHWRYSSRGIVSVCKYTHYVHVSLWISLFVVASLGLDPRQGVYSCELYSQGHRVWGQELDPSAAAFILNLRNIQSKLNMLQTHTWWYLEELLRHKFNLKPHTQHFETQGSG